MKFSKNPTLQHNTEPHQHSILKQYTLLSTTVDNCLQLTVKEIQIPLRTQLNTLLKKLTTQLKHS